MAGSFWFGGQLMSDFGVYLLEGTERQVLAPSRDRLIEIPGKHGVYDFAPEYAPREFRLRCVVLANSHSQLLSRLQDIARAFDLLSGLQPFIFESQADRYWQARYQGQSVLALGAINAELDITLLCPDPFAFSTTESQQINSIPGTFNISVGGDAEAWPVYELTASLGGSGTVSISNNTLGKTLHWTGSWALGDVLKIDTQKWIVYINNSPSMSGVSGNFPKLKGGTSNSLTISGMTGTCKITFRARWL
ncbi:phage tail family protein [Dehalococcoidia bacterium]|nr:phage tail family protein [Dehalococcoidia bacterium]